MNDQTDSQLLCAYAESRSEAAFAELVRRHVDFVYSAARRMMVDPHLAEDVTQGVFVAFAKNAHQLTDRSVFSGWLHRTAQNIAAQTVRTIERRRAREQEAVAMNELLSHEPDAAWENVAPHLDTALGELSEPDRDALLLRYFEKKSARKMAQVLNVSEEAAQKRVNRAVERLRELFSKRNVTIGTSGLAIVISANAVQAAPIGLAAVISTTVTAATITIATHTTMHWINLKSVAAIFAAAVVAGTGTHFVQRGEANRLRNENQTLIAQQKQLTEPDTALPSAFPQAEESEQAQKDKKELLRLRGEVGLLRQQIAESKVRENNDRQNSGVLATQNSAASEPTPAQKTQAKELALNTINAMKQIGLAVRLYANDHRNVYATNFNQITNELPPHFKDGLSLDAFEFVTNATPVSDRKHHDKIFARERIARQTPEGKWARVYGFANGRVEEHQTDDGNFEAWEREHMVMTP